MRGKGEGSLYKRADGLWVGSVELAPRPGNPRPRKTVTSKDKATAIRKLEALKADLEKHGDLPSESQTVEQWFEYWLRMKRKQIRPKSWANYTSLSKWIVGTIGKVRLSKLTAAHVRRVHDAMIAENLRESSQLSVHAIMSSAFGDAEREGRISRNPVRSVAAPRKNVAQLEVLTVTEATSLLTRFESDAEAALWATVLLTGGRRGEVLGLEWDRVTDVLDLSWQLQRHPVEMVAPADYEYRRLDGGLYLTRPKSKAGMRAVPLVEPLKSILDRWRAVAPSNPHGLVFATPNGRPIDPDQATRAWNAALAASGVRKKIRLHDLRHTAVDMLYEAGVPEVVITELVGHSSRAMSRAYKSRGNRPQLTDAMRQMAAVLGHQASTADSRELPSA